MFAEIYFHQFYIGIIKNHPFAMLLHKPVFFSCVIGSDERFLSLMTDFWEVVNVHESFVRRHFLPLATTSEKFRFTSSKTCRTTNTSEKSSRTSTSEKCRSNHYLVGMKGFRMTCCPLQICTSRWQLTNNGKIRNSQKKCSKVDPKMR